MNAGALRNQISIETKTISTDAYGGTVETWNDICAAWAAIEPLQGRELVSAQAVNAETTVKITMRYRSGMTTDKRIVHAGKYYNVLSVLDVENRHQQLICLCSEGLNEG